MQVTREDLNPCTVLFTVTSDASEVAAGFQKALKQIAKQVRVPGFRPGHAPASLVEKMVNPDDVRSGAAEEIINNAYRKILQDEKLEPIQPPAVTISKLERDEPACEFKVKVPLKPIVELGDFTTIKIERPAVDVTDEEVDEQLDELRKKSGKREAITDRGVRDGDVAVVNIRPSDSDDSGSRNFMTIVGQTFDQLDKALLSMHVEDIKSLELSFPENFQEKEWAGKKMKVQVVLRSVSSVTLPEADDAFAKGVGEKYKSLKSDDLAELKKNLRERIFAAKNEMAQEMVNERIQDELVRISKVEVADNTWEGVAQRRLSELQVEAKERGMTMEEYAKTSGMSIEELVEKWNSEARMYVRRSQLVHAVFEKEKLQVTNQELNEEFVVMAREYEVGAEELLGAMKKNGELQQQLQIRAVFKKVMNHLMTKVEILEPVSAKK